MVRLTVLYGQPTDPEAFLDYYEHTHVPLASGLPHLVRNTWGKCLPGLDGAEPPYFLIAELVWNSAEDLGAALTSEQGAATAGDVANFATGGATMVVSEAHT